MVCTHLRLGIFATSFCVYVFIIEKGMKTCKAGHFGNNHLCLCLCCSRKMYSCETGHLGNQPLCFCLCSCRGYEHM